jgi:drug/metabolite transporter (DMT)-like permease
VERPRHSVVLYTLVLLTVLGWSFNFIIGKLTLRYINPWALTSFRIELSGLLMVPIYFARPRRTRFHRTDLWNFAVLGFFGVVINRGLFIVGLNYTTAGHSALIVATGPILVLLLARAHNLERVTRAKIIGMTTCFVGVAILVAGDELHGHAGTWVGDLIALGGTSGFALYTVLAKKVARQYDTISMNTFCNLAGAIFLLPLAAREAAKLDWGAVGAFGWFGLGYTVLVSSIGAYLVFFWALAHMKASRLAVLTYLETPIAALLAVLMLGDSVTTALLVGGGLILAGVYLAEFGPGTAEVPVETAGA